MEERKKKRGEKQKQDGSRIEGEEKAHISAEAKFAMRGMDKSGSKGTAVEASAIRRRGRRGRANNEKGGGCSKSDRRTAAGRREDGGRGVRTGASVTPKAQDTGPYAERLNKRGGRRKTKCEDRGLHALL